MMMMLVKLQNNAVSFKITQVEYPSQVGELFELENSVLIVVVYGFLLARGYSTDFILSPGCYA